MLPPLLLKLLRKSFHRLPIKVAVAVGKNHKIAVDFPKLPLIWLQSVVVVADVVVVVTIFIVVVSIFVVVIVVIVVLFVGDVVAVVVVER